MTSSNAMRARWAITAVFGGNGLLIASLVARTPQLKLDLDLSPAQLGLTSAAFGVAAVVAMQGAGALAARVGSGWVVRLAVLVLPVALIGIGGAPSLVSLMLLLLGFGAVHGLLDVTMNAHAVAVERVLGRPIMNGCHAAWSIGAVVGSLVGSAAAHAGTSRSLHYAVLAAALLPAALACGRLLLPGYADRRGVRARRSSPRDGWSRRIVVFGAMGATVLTVEAAVANWSGVYLHENLGAPLGAASLGYLAFTACQTAGRLVGDRLQAGRDAAKLVVAGTLVAVAGLAAVVLSPSPAVAVVGFAVVGVGLATPLPVLFGVVGHHGAAGAGAAVAVARFSTMTYTGILVAPAVIGWVAELIGLTWTLAGLIPLLALVARAAAPAIHRAPRLTATG
ncbi:MFS transporter [Phytohabitans sp. LJ34]|uniref:MFS transporter n=1 Tax=Phytohabitans sp. LJ34 TaxID=3452217 RepID=UPI003F888D8A